MVETEVQELKRRIEAARDFARREVHDIDAEASTIEDPMARVFKAQEAGNYRAIERVLDVILAAD